MQIVGVTCQRSYLRFYEVYGRTVLFKPKKSSALQCAVETPRGEMGKERESEKAGERCNRRAVQFDSGAGVQICRTVGQWA